MDLYIFDRNFNKIAVIDFYKSILWVDRYDKPGEFELYMSADVDVLQNLKYGYYVMQKESEHMCIIENIKIETSIEDGNHYTITGRGLESILDRRIVWKQTIFNNVSLQNAIQSLLNENIISPSLTARKISNFVFKASTDTKITSLKLTAQYTGDNLLDVIEKICDDAKIGFKVTLNTSNQFVFELYSGVDRSYAQFSNDFVVFSPDFDNIINSNYYESETLYKNVTLVAGDGEGNNRKTYTVGNVSGLDRKELYTDARDISSKDEDNNDIPISTYNEMLKQRGQEKLTETTKIKQFDGKVDSSRMYVFGRDFYMGDVIQIKNEYKLEGPARVVEYVMSENIENGLEYYPTFEAIHESEG